MSDNSKTAKTNNAEQTGSIELPNEVSVELVTKTELQDALLRIEHENYQQSERRRQFYYGVALGVYIAIMLVVIFRNLDRSV